MEQSEHNAALSQLRAVAQAQLRSGQLLEALRAARKLVGLQAAGSDDWSLLGRVYRELRAWRAAQRAFHRVLELEPAQPAALRQLARIAKQTPLGDQEPFRARFQANCELLASRHPELWAAVDRPEHHQEAQSYDLVELPGGLGLHCLDPSGEFIGGYYGCPREQAEKILDSIPKLEQGFPCLFASIWTGELLLALMRRTNELAMRQPMPLFVLESSPSLFQVNLRLHDLSEVLASGRIHFYLGKDALDQLTRDLERDPFLPLPVTVLKLVAGEGGEIEQALAREEERRQQEVNRLMAEVRGRCDSLRSAGWAQRFAGGRSLSLLLVTSRYTQVGQHALGNLARWAEKAGHRTCVLTEPSAGAGLTLYSIARVLAESRPDLIVAVNDRRRDPIPRTIPWVTWVQDYAPENYSRQAAARFGPRDYLLAVTTSPLLGYGYPPDRVFTQYPVADPELYRPLSLSASDQQRYGSEVCLVTHWNTTPQQVRAIWQRDNECRRHGLADMLDGLMESVRDHYRQGKGYLADWDIEELLSRMERDRGMRIPDGTREQCLGLFTEHLNRSLFRQQVARWLAARAYRLRIYGQGWQRDPVLAPYHAGVAAYGEELCKVYNAARIVLHPDFYSFFHFRTVDCWAASGFVLVLDNPSVRRYTNCKHVLQLAARPGVTGFDELLAAIQDADLRLRLDYCRRDYRHRFGTEKTFEDYVEGLRRIVERVEQGDDISPDVIVDDVSCFLFRDREELFARCDYFLANPQEGAASSARMRQVVLDRFTAERAVRDLVRRVGQNLAEQSARESQ